MTTAHSESPVEHPEGFRLSFAWGLARRTEANDLEAAKEECARAANNSLCAVSLLDGATYSVLGQARYTTSTGNYVYQEAVRTPALTTA